VEPAAVVNLVEKRGLVNTHKRESRMPLQNFLRHSQWPALAWCARISQGLVEVDAGSGVEAFNDRIFEGAWDGDFSNFDFHQAINVLGSGLIVQEDGVLFVTPSNTLECVFVVDRKGTLIAANSLPLVLQRSGHSLRLRGAPFGAVFASIMFGLDHSPVIIPLASGGKCLAYYHHNVFFRFGDAKAEIRPKAFPPAFANYREYRSYLDGVVSRVCSNARHQDRIRQYYPVTTISSGYDSPACAVLARENGCRIALNIEAGESGEPDDGRLIGEMLGLEVISRPREATDADAYAAMLSNGMQAEDAAHATFRDLQAGALLFTGFHGDKVWSCNEVPDRKIKRKDISGSAIAEYRLEVDFIQLPIPFIGSQNFPEIQHISNSEEMRPFAIGGDYDRPIPRRIVEEAGVARTAFGMVKRAVSYSLHRRNFERTIPQELVQFVAGCRVNALRRKHYSLGLRYWRWRKYHQHARYLNLPITLLDAVFRGDPVILEYAHPATNAWLRWSYGRLQTRYQ
jgi:hypothetical protein